MSETTKTQSEDQKPVVDAESKEVDSTEYVGETRRWFILLLVSMGSTFGASIFVMYQPISIPLADAFELESVIHVNALNIGNLINQVPITFVAVFFYSRFKAHNVLRGVITMQMVGAVIRALCFFGGDYWTLIVGSALCSCCNPFFFNVQTTIANKWFLANERAMATALQTLGMPLGTVLGYGLVAGWFAGRQKDQPPEEFREEFSSLMFTHAIMIFIGWIVFLIIMREKPSQPPSAVAEKEVERLSCKIIGETFSGNANFVMLVIAFALPFGSFQAIGTLMSNLFDPYGYSPTELAFIALDMLFFGVLGTVLMGKWLDKTKLYKLTMNVLGSIVILVSVLILAALKWYPDSRATMYILFGLLGFSAIGFVPLCFAFGAELTFPLEPTLVTGTMTTFGSIVGGGISFLGALVIKDRASDDDLPEDELADLRKTRSLYVVFIITVSTTIATILSCCIKEDLRRLNYKPEDETAKSPAEETEKEASKSAEEPVKAEDSAEVQPESNNIQDKEKERWVEDDVI